jgi:hypothetical protein
LVFVPRRWSPRRLSASFFEDPRAALSFVSLLHCKAQPLSKMDGGAEVRMCFQLCLFRSAPPPLCLLRCAYGGSSLPCQHLDLGFTLQCQHLDLGFTLPVRD